MATVLVLIVFGVGSVKRDRAPVKTSNISSSSVELI